MNIRKECPMDYVEIHHVVSVAFEKAEHSDGTESELVDRLRNSEAYIPELALVAEAGGNIIGYIMLTLVQIGSKEALAVGPLAVLPAYQRSGIGSALIHAGHEKAKNMGYVLCVLVGHADYYPRFGYQPASTFGIHTHLDVPDDIFMAYQLQGNHARMDGMLHYPNAWGLN